MVVRVASVAESCGGDSGVLPRLELGAHERSIRRKLLGAGSLVKQRPGWFCRHLARRTRPCRARRWRGRRLRRLSRMRYTAPRMRIWHSTPLRRSARSRVVDGDRVLAHDDRAQRAAPRRGAAAAHRGARCARAGSALREIELIAVGHRARVVHRTARRARDRQGARARHRHPAVRRELAARARAPRARSAARTRASCVLDAGKGEVFARGLSPRRARELETLLAPARAEPAAARARAARARLAAPRACCGAARARAAMRADRGRARRALVAGRSRAAMCPDGVHVARRGLALTFRREGAVRPARARARVFARQRRQAAGRAARALGTPAVFAITPAARHFQSCVASSAAGGAGHAVVRRGVQSADARGRQRRAADAQGDRDALRLPRHRHQHRAHRRRHRAARNSEGRIEAALHGAAGEAGAAQGLAQVDRPAEDRAARAAAPTASWSRSPRASAPRRPRTW